MRFQPESDQHPRSLKPFLRSALITSFAAALCLSVGACSGGGGGSDSGSGDADIVIGTLWPQADSNPPGAFDTTLPAAAESVRYVFRSNAGYSCCVVIDPDVLSGNRAITLESLPAGPATIQVSGYPTSFAELPEGVTDACGIDPDIGRSCSRNRLSSPSFDSGPRFINVAAGRTTNAGDVQVPSVPFVLLPSLAPAPNVTANTPLFIGFTVAEAIFGVDPGSVEAALIPLGGSRRNLTVVLRACSDGTATPCSDNGQLKVRGFISNATNLELVPTGATGLELAAQNLAPMPAAMEVGYRFTAVPGVPTPTPSHSATPTRTTPSAPTKTPPATRTNTPTITVTRAATFTPSITRTPKEVSLAFVPASSFGVSQEPSHMAVADFNNDGRDDVAVASPESNEVNILLGNVDGSFTPGTVARFGTFPAWISAGDLNGDEFVDLAVADAPRGGVYLMFGGPNATFSDPSLRRVGGSASRPFGVAIGNFDAQTGNDLAVTDGAINRVHILLNDGKPSPTFRSGGNATVGAEPADIVLTDFNLDDGIDVATLNNGGAAVKDVTLLAFNRIDNGLVTFNRVANLVVGDRPLDLSVAELNSDGRPDLIMLNRPADDGFGELSYLLSRPDGFLTQTDPLVVHCPDRNVNCRARAMAVGDFDDDNISDVALTLNQAGQGTDTDILRVFIGSGDGAFIPGPTLPTEGQPLAMATGDITGDGLIDVIVSSAQADSVQVFVNVGEGD